MSLDTYTGLQEAVADWLNRVGSPEVAARTPDFIRMFESKFDNYDPPVRHPQMTVRATAEIDSEYTKLPPDFLEMQRLRIVTPLRGTLRYLTPEEFEDEKVRRKWDTTRYAGTFTVIGDELQIYPFNDSEPMTAEMVYWGKLPKLSDSVATNWLMAEYPSAYLYGALLEATPYLRDDERIAVWSAGLSQAMDFLIAAGDRARRSAGTLKPRRRKLG